MKLKSINYDEQFPIIGHPEYLINKKGEIFNKSGKRLYGTVKDTRSAKRIEIVIDGKCYDPITLLAIQFIPNPDGLKYVGAIDNNRLNTHITNVEWTNRKHRRLVSYSESELVEIFDIVLKYYHIDHQTLSKKYKIPEWIISRMKFIIHYMKENDFRVTSGELISYYQPMVYQGITSDDYVINIFGILKNKRNGNIVIGNIADGYCKGHILHNNTFTTVKIHKAVAETFIQKTEEDIDQNRCIVNHKNGCKFDPCVWNLEWVNENENRSHARQTGLLDSVIGINNRSCIHTEDQIHKICQLLITGKYGPSQIAKMTGSTKNVVKSIKRGSKWCHISQYYNMKYFEFDISGKYIGENKTMTDIVNKRISDKMKNSHLNKTLCGDIPA